MNIKLILITLAFLLHFSLSQSQKGVAAVDKIEVNLKAGDKKSEIQKFQQHHDLALMIVI